MTLSKLSIKNRKSSLSIAILAACGFIFLSVSACQSSRHPVNAATATARAENVLVLATQMGERLRLTEAVEGPMGTATAQARQIRLEAAANWPVLIAEPFDHNDNEWVVGEEDGDLTMISWHVENGKYQWTSTAKEAFVYWTRPAMYPVTDFFLSAEIEVLDGPANAEAGVVFRIQDPDHYYTFQIDEEGWYSFYRLDGEEWIPLIPWTFTPAVQPGGVNRVSVLGEGPDFTLFINGEVVDEATDTALSDGTAGVIIGLNNPGDAGVFAFDNFELRSP